MNVPGAEIAELFARACTLEARGDLPAAERQLREVLAQAPLHVEALRMLARCCDGMARGEDASIARRLADGAEVAQGLRAAAALAGTPIEAKAEALLRRLAAQHPMRAEPAAALIDWLRRAGRWREAWEFARQARRQIGEHSSLNTRLEAFEGDRAPRSGEEPVPVPFRVVVDMLDARRHGELLAFAQQARPSMGRSRVGNAAINDGLNEEMRRSRTVKVTQDIQAWFEPLVRAQAARHCRGLGLAVAPTGQVEMEFTAHNDGDFYRHHQDRGLNTHYASRRISYVYYFHRQPRGFDGGDLALYDRGVPVDLPLLDRYTRLPAGDNQLVMFPSDAWHEVLPVRCASKAYEDSRFTIVGWVLGDPTREE